MTSCHHPLSAHAHARRSRDARLHICMQVGYSCTCNNASVLPRLQVCMHGCIYACKSCTTAYTHARLHVRMQESTCACTAASAPQSLLTSAAGKQRVSSIVLLSAFLPVSLMPSYVVAVLQLVLVPGGLRLLRSQYPCCYVEGVHLSSAAVQRCVSAKFCNSALPFSVYG